LVLELSGMGAAIFMYASSLEGTMITADSNIADSDGGFLYGFESKFNLNQLTATNNKAGANGGAILMLNDETSSYGLDTFSCVLEKSTL
jgi:hypothetical protein